MHRLPQHCVVELHKEITALRKLDLSNQQMYTQRLLAGRRPLITKSQMCFLSEGLFFAASRCLEKFLAETFLLYCTGKYSYGRKHVRSFLNPRSVRHATDLIQSAMPFLEWSSPDTVIGRAEVYLDSGFPVKQALTTHRDSLRDMKHLRNHIAHLSRESESEYRKVLRKHYGFIPLNIPCPGEFLLLPHTTVANQYNLLYYFRLVEKVSAAIA